MRDATLLRSRWRGCLNSFPHGGWSVEEARRELFELSKRIIPVREKEVRRVEEPQPPMEWELGVEDVLASEGFMEVRMKGRGVAVRLKMPYDEHGLRFFRRLAEEGLKVRMRLSFT